MESLLSSLKDTVFKSVIPELELLLKDFKAEKDFDILQRLVEQTNPAFSIEIIPFPYLDLMMLPLRLFLIVLTLNLSFRL